MSFDSLLIQICSILSDDSTTLNAYNQKPLQPKDWDVVAVNIPCRLSTDSIGHPREFRDDVNYSLNYRRVFMRQPTLSNGKLLNPHHAILIDGIYFNIIEVLLLRNSIELHHIEVIVEEVRV